MKDKEAAVCMKYMYVAPNYKYFKKYNKDERIPGHLMNYGEIVCGVFNY